MGTYYEIVKEIQCYKEQFDKNDSFDFYYRGQANIEWKLETTLKRSGKSFYDMEKNDKWDDNCSAFENIAKMQYYGEPTRLLDYTTDYDIALYFACEDKTAKDKDGIMFVCYYGKREANWVDVKLITELSFLNHEMTVKEFITIFLEKYPEMNYDKDSAEEFGLRVLSWIDHGFMVTPSQKELEKLKEKNIRIYNQKGVFFVEGNKLKRPHAPRSSRTLEYNVILPELADLPTTITYPGFIKEIKIPKEEKNNLLEILNEKGINEAFLFPDK